MTSSAVKRMISKFEGIGYFGVRLCGGPPSISAKAAWTVQEEMEIVAVSSKHGKVSAYDVTRHTGISMHYCLGSIMGYPSTLSL